MTDEKSWRGDTTAAAERALRALTPDEQRQVVAATLRFFTGNKALTCPPTTSPEPRND